MAEISEGTGLHSDMLLYLIFYQKFICNQVVVTGSSIMSPPSRSGVVCNYRVSPCLSRWKLLITSPEDGYNDLVDWPFHPSSG